MVRRPGAVRGAVRKIGASADEDPRHQPPFSAQSVEYVKEISSYLWDTDGRFPVHVDAFHVPGIRAQFSHLEMEYYKKFYKPELFAKQAAHDATWEH